MGGVRRDRWLLLAVLRFGPGCDLEHRRGDRSSVRTSTASESDCLRLAQWATGERLIKALMPTSAAARACMAMEEPRTLFESTTAFTFLTDRPLTLKTSFCNVEPFVTHRRCMQLVVDRYFPPR